MKARSYFQASPVSVIRAIVPAMAFAAAACGPAVQNLVWPPLANPTMDGLYPYDFESRGVDAVKGMHHRMLTGQVGEGEQEKLLLYALGRAQIDAFLWGVGLAPDAKAEFFGELGDMVGVEATNEDVFIADPRPLLEPFDMISINNPDDPLAKAAQESRIVFHLFSREDVGNEEMAFIRDQAAGQGPISPFARGVVVAVIHTTLDSAAGLDPGERGALIVDVLEPYLGPPAEGEVHTDRLVAVLAWCSKTIEAALKDPDPLALELRPRILAARKLLRSTAFPVGLPDDAVLPDLVDASGEILPDPFRYVVVAADGSIRVATGLVLTVDESGAVAHNNASGGYGWPGRTVEDMKTLPSMVEEATHAVEELGPAGGSPYWDRAAPLAIDPSVGAESVEAIVAALRPTTDHVVMAIRSDTGIHFVGADIRPNCAMAGTRLGAVLRGSTVTISNVTVGDEDEALVGDAGQEQPLLLAERVADQAESALGKPHPDVFVEVAWQSGAWTWGQVVAVHEGLVRAVSDRASAAGAKVRVQSFLLPSMTMAESRDLEKQAGQGGALDPLPGPDQANRESIALFGAYGDYDKDLLDAWLSAYLDGLPLDYAATVVLDVARCWGGDYRDRAVEALSLGKREILEQVASYLGDPVMGVVAESILKQAGEASVPVLVWKMLSLSEAVWTGAWHVLASLAPGAIGEGLAPLLSNEDPQIRIRALKLYGNSIPAGEHEELLPLLDDPDLGVRIWAMATVGMLGMQSASPRLVEYASDPHTQPELLSEAIFALGLLEAHEALPLILKCAGSKHASVRESAALALGNVGAHPDEVIPALLGLLSDEEPTVVLNAIGSLAVVGDDRALQYFEVLLDSPHAAIAQAAADAAAKIEKAGHPDLTELEGAQVKKICSTLQAQDVMGLALNPSDEAYDCLVGLLKNADPLVREASCAALGERGDPAAIPALTKRTKDKKPEVRLAAWSAIETLQKIADKNAKEAKASKKPKAD